MGGIERFFLSSNTLPVMPEVARQLIASFDDEKVDLNTIVSLTAQEQSLALRILRLANSAQFARSRNVTSLTDAAHVALDSCDVRRQCRQALSRVPSTRRA